MSLARPDDAQRPPFIRRNRQYDNYIGATGTETPGDAQKLISQFERVHNLWHNGTWWLDMNETDANAVVITGGYYDPDFRVRAFKVNQCVVNSAENPPEVDKSVLFTQIMYDTPHSLKVIDVYACGALIQGHITRLWLGDSATEDWIRISLYG